MATPRLDQARRAALAETLELFPRRTQERGRAYAAEGRAKIDELDETQFAGLVRGSEVYRTSWQFDEEHGWESWCDCPVAEYCKHAYALAAVLLADRGVAADGRRAPARGTERGGNGLRRLREARAEWERQSALDELLSGAPVLGLNPYTPPLLDVLHERDPDLLCWQLAQTIPGLAGGWLPPLLEPYRNRPDLAERYRSREHAVLAAELVGWAQRRSEEARRRLRLILAVVERGGDYELVFEARVTTPRLIDVPRTALQLQQMRAELLRAPGSFPAAQADVLGWLADHAFDAVAPEARPNSLSTQTPLPLLERIADTGMASWADDMPAAIAARGGIRGGAPVRLSSAAARVLPDCVSGDEGLSIELRVVWPDGRRRRLQDVLLIPSAIPGEGRRATVVVADGLITPLAEEPPPGLLARFRQLGALPVPRDERTEMVGLLAARFPHLETTLAAHTRLYPSTASIALDLRPDDWLQVRLFAQSGPTAWQPGAPAAGDAALFEYTFERGWVRCDASSAGAAEPMNPAGPAAATAAPTRAAAAATESAPVAAATADDDVWLEAPAEASVAAAVAWLDAVPVTAGIRLGGSRAPNWQDRAVGWWMRASRRSMEALADAWERRPPGVAFFGSERARRLLGGARALAPRLRIAASGVDWLSISAEWEAEGVRLSDEDLARLREATTRFVRLESGWVAKEVGNEQGAIAAALGDLGIDIGAGEQRLTMWQLAGASPTTLSTLARYGGDGETAAALERLRARIAAFDGLPQVALPAGLTAELRPYQRRGLDFLAHASSLGIGAVLADDMGLGKTVQALAWLLHLRASEPSAGPSLVVCPASVVHNWAREAARFAPELRVLLLTSGKDRHALREAIPEHDLVVTNYALLRRDIEAWRGVELQAAILDEAQFIKNPDAAVSRAARELQARHRLALTGTPLENRALDLWSICAFATPGYLGNRNAFAARFDRADAPLHVRTLLAAKLRPLLLRRTKQAVAPELPPRIEELLDCGLTRDQRQLYIAELQRSRTLLAQVTGMPDGLARNKITILAALTRLRQICCHPALAGGRAELPSGKFEALFELLDPLLAEGHKVLVFSQFVQCLKLLAGDMRTRGIRFHMLTGQTAKREQVVSAFQADPDPCVFLISLKAGGTGLNLTAASYVVLFDPWWNPAVEAQAIDRTHRIGQESTVIAYRMLTRGTIEEKIWELQQRKAELVREVLGEGGFARALTREDMEFLLADVELDDAEG